MADEFPVIVVPESDYDLSEEEQMGTKNKFWFITQNLVAACTNSLERIQVKIGQKKLQPSCANCSDCPMLNMNWQLGEVNAELCHHHFCPMVAVSFLGIKFCLRTHRTKLILC